MHTTTESSTVTETSDKIVGALAIAADSPSSGASEIPIIPTTKKEIYAWYCVDGMSF